MCAVARQVSELQYVGHASKRAKLFYNLFFPPSYVWSSVHLRLSTPSCVKAETAGITAQTGFNLTLSINRNSVQCSFVVGWLNLIWHNNNFIHYKKKKTNNFSHELLFGNLNDFSSNEFILGVCKSEWGAICSCNTWMYKNIIIFLTLFFFYSKIIFVGSHSFSQGWIFSRSVLLEDTDVGKFLKHRSHHLKQLHCLTF